MVLVVIAIAIAALLVLAPLLVYAANCWVESQFAQLVYIVHRPTVQRRTVRPLDRKLSRLTS